MELSLTTTREPGPTGEQVVLVVAGTLDVHRAPQLRQRLVDLAGTGWHDLVLDLEDVAEVDAYGLGVLLAGAARARARGGRLQLVCTRAALLGPLRATGLVRLLPVHASVAAALRAPRPTAALVPPPRSAPAAAERAALAG